LLFPLLIDQFEAALSAQANDRSIVSIVHESPYEIAKILSTIFYNNQDRQEIRNIVYIKYVTKNQDKILQTIGTYADESFADSLVLIAAKTTPVQLYSFAQSRHSNEGKLIHRSPHHLVQAVAKLSQTPNALFYFPFLDDILTGKN